MNISAEQVRDLREKTGAGMMDCKKALSETSGNFEKAIEYLRKKGIASADKKAGRATNEGSVTSYIHAGGKVGVLAEINCETDFVARTDKFKAFCEGIGMHIAAAAPRWTRVEDVPADVIAKEKEIAVAQMESTGKPKNVLEQIAEGKVKKFLAENCLLNQEYVMEAGKTVDQVIKEAIASLGENISVKRFVRFQLGEESK